MQTLAVISNVLFVTTICMLKSFSRILKVMSCEIQKVNVHEHHKEIKMMVQCLRIHNRGDRQTVRCKVFSCQGHFVYDVDFEPNNYRITKCVFWIDTALDAVHMKWGDFINLLRNNLISNG